MERISPASGERSRALQTEQRQIETLLGIIDRSKLTGSEAAIFNTLFPPDLPARTFRIESVQQSPLVEYSPEEKKVARYALGLFGFSSPKYRTYKGDEDIPELRIAYNGKNGAPSTHLNHLPCMAILADTGQTDPRLPDQPDVKNAPRTKMTRKDHSKHMASMVVRDLVRMAIKTPDLFYQRVLIDLHRYGYGDGEHMPEVMQGRYYEKLFKEKTASGYLHMSEKQIRALALAMEYAKYLALFAYLHDERTPAWGDIIMKARERFPGQATVEYSEDETLAHDIGVMTQDPDTGIQQFIQQFRMNREFFVRLTRSLSHENDSGLGGILMKSKRKTGFVENGGPSELAGLQSFDEDQVSGTIANMEDLAGKVLPGGFGYMYKQRSDVPSTNARPLLQPIGSFHDRLQLLMYALSAGLSKKSLTSFCKRHGIPPERVFIAAEEFQIGPNFLLIETPTETREILPVSLDPGSLKRVMEAFAGLTYFHYQSDRRAAIKTFIQDVFTTIHQYQLHTQLNNMQPVHHESEHTQILDFALQRSDYAFTQTLNEYLPLLPFIIRDLFSFAERIPESELRTRIEAIQNEGRHYLVSRAPMRPLTLKNMKPGSLTITYKGDIEGYIDVIDNKWDPEQGTVQENPLSLPNRMRQTAEALTAEDYYFVFGLDDALLNRMAELVEAMPSPQYRNVVKRAIRYWTLELRLGNGEPLSNPLARDARFCLQEEDQSMGLTDQSDLQDIDLTFLIHAQHAELQRLSRT